MLKEELQKLIEGDVDDSPEVIDEHSRDASLFEIEPDLVVFPKNEKDVQAIVRYVDEHKGEQNDLSITPRSAGTCMAGGSLNTSIIMDFLKYMHGTHDFRVKDRLIGTLPGTFYRDFEKETLEEGLIYPGFPASKSICALGGIVANNGAGEKTLKYGKAEDYVKELDVILSDGSKIHTKPLNSEELEEKKKEDTFEGKIYRELHQLIEDNYDKIQAAKPDVSKNSAGYYLWNIWSKEMGIFDLTKLIVGSQGTLGIVTDIEMSLVPVEKESMMLAIFLYDRDHLGDIVNDALSLDPESVEAYDDKTMKLAMKFWTGFIKKRGLFGAAKLGLSFLPELGLLLKSGFPSLVLLVNFTGDDKDKLFAKIKQLETKIAKYEHIGSRRALSEQKAEKYWAIRHDSFALMREHFQNKRTAPFIDDVIVKPEYFPEFLPKVQKILDEYDLFYNIHGHAGNGNFHLVPLMDWDDNFAADMILEVSDKIYSLVLEYGGSITAEHNDGIIRTPYLEQMYGHEIIELFKKTKEIFDPKNIFNPGKKVGGTLDDVKKYLIKPKKS